MDKKRRKKTSPKHTYLDKKNIDSLYAICELIETQGRCGIISKKYRFLETYGTGFFEHHRFDGLHIVIFDVFLKQDVCVNGYLSKDFLELSFLIEGEQIITIDGISQDLIYESQECYLLYLSKIKGTISYHQRKRLKEIKIRMDIDFIKRHRLDEEYNIMEKYSLQTLKNNFVKPLCARTQDILSDILSDKRQGLLKRLFLESKSLELISLKLENSSDFESKRPSQPDNLIKKMYQVQHIITSDLSVQHSIPQISRQIGLNDFVLKKEFKQLFGQTIFEYASELRMNKAKQLLLHSKKPIYEISELIGYKNPTHFTAAFKKTENITPKVYRNNYQ